ncbi:olfactory receptor 5AR1-like isoform X2 [Dendropsophus ebraccatus]|uniref:olfactory receptor 5AR1-like isoform X2 n=1 Tax=Dendropsophus ebraccatus TaxID=150705 RepID=UPI0038322959
MTTFPHGERNKDSSVTPQLEYKLQGRKKANHTTRNIPNNRARDIYRMNPEATDNMTEFSIHGLSEIPELQLPIFITILLLYVLIIFGNVTVIAVIGGNTHLHSPMYNLLLNLSLIDVAYTSNILPKLLTILLAKQKVISFVACMVQLYFFIALASIEVIILAAMGYDRYVAICRPLHYSSLMSQKHCSMFATSAWVIGFLDPTGHICLVSKLSFCASHHINHFFCDLAPLLKISCSDTYKVEMFNYIVGSLLTLSTFLLTLISYVFIILTILNIKSAKGRYKAFSTCSSHLTCISIFYGTIICLYMRPASSYYPQQDKFFGLLYIVLVPLLNPIIYSLKNKDFNAGIKKIMLKLTL